MKVLEQNRTVLEGLECLLLKYQEISIVMRDFSKINPLVNTKKCQMLLKAALKGAVSCKNSINNIISASHVKEEDDNELSELGECLDVLLIQFRKFGDANFKFSEKSTLRRDNFVCTDFANLFLRHCVSCHRRDGSPYQPSGRFIDIAHAPPPNGLQSPIDYTMSLDHWKPPRGHTSYSWLNPPDFVRETPSCRQGSRYGCLLGMVAFIRQLECSDYFRKLLLESQAAQSLLSGDSIDNFTYGTTPFSSWIQLFENSDQSTDASMQDTIQEAVADMSLTSEPSNSVGSRYVVFGSALGLLAFYGAVGLGWRTTGVEILPELCKESRLIADRFDIPMKYTQLSVVENSDNTHEDQTQLQIIEGNMLLFRQLGDARVVLLTSQCWSKELIQLVHDKLGAELHAGSLVIDYTLALLSWHSSIDGHCFEKIKTVTAPVSWNQDQKLHMFRFRKAI